uniref:Utilizing regulatory protein tutB n=1 Tax=Thauera aromatica TaxID=59405 RepID=P96140_THAAR|nr:utilizing regulatory protein tutB [Thauera aromatica]
MCPTIDASTVYLVDDDRSMRDAISSLVRSVGLNVETFASASEFLEHARSEACACLVLDVRMPRMSGFDLQHALSKNGVDIPIIFITGHGDIPMAVRAIKSGALEFLPKPFRAEELLEAINRALNIDQEAREYKAELDKILKKYEGLTDREKEVFPLIAQGLLNKQIAGYLGITEVTIKVHRHNITRKMGVRTLANLVRLYEKLKNAGLIEKKNGNLSG